VKVQCSFKVVDGKPGPIEHVEGQFPDGTFVIGWGMSHSEEMLLVAFSTADGKTMLRAQAGTVMGDPVPTRWG
jgi:hypothetical protein